jgi:ATP/ADP translocase
MIGVTGLAFFALTMFGGFFAPLTAMLGLSPLMMAVFVGAAQNILSKSSKYSLFDPCKEMAYIPLDRESKTKGKAAIDVIGNPLGKSGGALIQQVLIFGVGSLAATMIYTSLTISLSPILVLYSISPLFSWVWCLCGSGLPIPFRCNSSLPWRLPCPRVSVDCKSIGHNIRYIHVGYS